MQAPHIAEPDDAAMTRLEGQMTAAAPVAGNAVDELGRTLPPAARPQLDAARAALSRFMAIHGEIITLSRRNTNVRSLALSLGRKRVLTAACEELLQAFETALGRMPSTPRGRPDRRSRAVGTRSDFDLHAEFDDALWR